MNCCQNYFQIAIVGFPWLFKIFSILLLILWFLVNIDNGPQFECTSRKIINAYLTSALDGDIIEHFKIL